MLGGVVKLQFSCQVSSLFRLEGFIERTGSVGVEIVQHDADPFSLREVGFNQIIHASRKILLGPLRGDLDMPPTRQRLQEDEQIAGAFPVVFIIKAFGSARSTR